MSLSFLPGQSSGQRILVGSAFVLSLVAHLWVLDVFVDKAALPKVSINTVDQEPNVAKAATLDEGQVHTRLQPTPESGSATALEIELDKGHATVQGVLQTGADNSDDSDHEEVASNKALQNITDSTIRSFRDGNQIEVLGVNVNSSAIFEAGMAILYIQFDSNKERKLFLERKAGILEAWKIEDIRDQYGDSILFFGDIIERTKKIRSVGLDTDTVNSGILLGKKAILAISSALKDNGVNSNIVRHKLIQFRFNNRTGDFTLVSIHELE